MGSHRSQTGRPRTWNISSEESCLSTRPKLGDWLGAPGRSFCWVMKGSSITAVLRASSSDASLSPKDKSCYKKYTRGLVATMQHLEPSWGMPSDKVSTGQPRWPMPLGLYAPAGGVNSTQSRHACPLRPCRRYPSPSESSLWPGNRIWMSPGGGLNRRIKIITLKLKSYSTRRQDRSGVKNPSSRLQWT
jgi:hypothetical protein